MAQIWTMSNESEWLAVALAGDTCTLTAAGPLPGDRPDPKAGDSRVLLRRVASTSDDTWALLADRSARLLVNGLPVPLGLVILADRDEIRVVDPQGPAGSPARPLFFSTERLAAVAPYPSGSRRASCPRCKQSLAPGDAAVRCPGCGLWHHATEALPCWTYGEQCAACPHPTALDAGFQWTPEHL